MKIEHIQKKDKAALPNVNEKTEFSRKNWKKSNNKIKKKTQIRNGHLFTYIYCASHKHFVPDKKMICIQ